MSAPDMKAAALFDFDGTLIKGDSITEYVRLAVLEKRVGPIKLCHIFLSALLAALGVRDWDGAKTLALSFLRDMTDKEREEWDARFAASLVSRVYPEGLKRLRAHQERGDRVIIVSASTENYMLYVARALDCELIATRVTEGYRAFGNCKGMEKARRLETVLSGVSLKDSSAYGDSRSDLPMLALCGHPFAVNAKKALRRAAPAIPRLDWRENA